MGINDADTLIISSHHFHPLVSSYLVSRLRLFKVLVLSLDPLKVLVLVLTGLGSGGLGLNTAIHLSSSPCPGFGCGSIRLTGSFQLLLSHLKVFPRTNWMCSLQQILNLPWGLLQIAETIQETSSSSSDTWSWRSSASLQVSAQIFMEEASHSSWPEKKTGAKISW